MHLGNYNCIVLARISDNINHNVSASDIPASVMKKDKILSPVEDHSDRGWSHIQLGYIEDFIAEIDAAKEHKSVFSILERYIKLLGFERYVYELMLPPGGGPQQSFFNHTYPNDWVNYYIDNHYSSDDIICRYSAQNLRPFIWSDFDKKLSLTELQAQILNDGKQAGGRSGATVPIHGPGAAKAYLIVASDIKEEEFAKLFFLNQHELHLMATYAHERLLSIGLPEVLLPDISLSPREIEIMKWTARGKSSWDISIILKLSEDTIKAHLHSVCKKLGVHNKTHATAIAVLQGLIIL